MKKIISIIIVIVVLAGLGFFAYQKFVSSPSLGNNEENGEVITPVADQETAGWQTYANAQYNFSLKYPANIFDENQQPRAFAGDCNYNVFPDRCPNINNIVANDMVSQGADFNIVKSNLSDTEYWDNPNGTKQAIAGVPYCLYSTGDAGAGHSFNYYYFVTVKNNKCLVIYLATSMENCDNYLPIEQGDSEQAANYNACISRNENQPKLLDKVISTFTFKK